MRSRTSLIVGGRTIDWHRPHIATPRSHFSSRTCAVTTTIRPCSGAGGALTNTQIRSASVGANCMLRSVNRSVFLYVCIPLADSNANRWESFPNTYEKGHHTHTQPYYVDRRQATMFKTQGKLWNPHRCGCVRERSQRRGLIRIASHDARSV